jgi:hypothetical protein
MASSALGPFLCLVADTKSPATDLLMTSAQPGMVGAGGDHMAWRKISGDLASEFNSYLAGWAIAASVILVTLALLTNFGFRFAL